MNTDEFEAQCNDATREYNIQIPCTLAKRLNAFVSENHTPIANVVVEALDFFLREQAKM